MAARVPRGGSASPLTRTGNGRVVRRSLNGDSRRIRHGQDPAEAKLDATALKPRLTKYVAAAVTSGLAELSRFDEVVGEAESRLELAREDLSGYQRAGQDEDCFIVVLDTVVADLRDRLGDCRRVASTFNIAFFGRTGAGKSTLLSALGGLDGLLVSDGQSDFTVEVQPLDWQGCRPYDTPGINGWGRTRPRAELEEKARQAVEIADVVLLCFYSQSQQASPFVKVAATTTCRNLTRRSSGV